MRLLNLLKRLNLFVISIDSYSYAKNQHHRPILCLENPGVPDQPHIKWTESNRCIYGSVNTCKKPPYTAAVLSTQLIHYFPLVWACLTIPTWIFTKFVDFIDVQSHEKKNFVPYIVCEILQLRESCIVIGLEVFWAIHVVFAEI